ncbi:MAG: cation transporter [Sulfurospirillum sp.]|nr:MAG: cation transporter [Sulfurospirillum sp.]
MKLWTLLLFFVLTLQAEILQVRQLFNFKTVTVEKRVSAETKTYYGKTAVDESRVRDVALRFDAFVTRLYADKKFMKVQKGDPLFRLYAKEVVSLTEELAISAKLSASALRNARRKLRLLGVPRLAAQKKAVESFDYFAPSDGYIISKKINEGSFAKRGERLMQLADFSRLWVIADVYQKDIAVLHEGMPAKIKVEGYPEVKGRVGFLYPTVDTAKETVPVRIVIDKNDKLFPGLFARVKIALRQKEQLILPKTALLQKGDKLYVFVPEGAGTFSPRQIKARRIDSRHFAVLEGLKEGDKVVDKALFLLDSDALTNGLYESDEEDEDW